MTERESMGKQEGEEIPYEVTPVGSLGLLALGDVGLKAWREARDKAGWKPGQGRPDSDECLDQKKTQ